MNEIWRYNVLKGLQRHTGFQPHEGEYIWQHFIDLLLLKSAHALSWFDHLISSNLFINPLF